MQIVVPENGAEAMEEDGPGLEEDAAEADARRKAAAKAAEEAELRKRSQALPDLLQAPAVITPLSPFQHGPWDHLHVFQSKSWPSTSRFECHTKVCLLTTGCIRHAKLNHIACPCCQKLRTSQFKPAFAFCSLLIVSVLA